MASESTVNSEHSMVHQNQGIVKKKKLVIVGSSHAKRMFLHFKENEEIRREFFIFNETKSGSLYSNQNIPKEFLMSLKKDDVCIFQLFGNDLVEKHIKIRYEGQKRIFVLEKFVPISQKKIGQMYCHFKRFVEKLQCKVLIVDNIYRHLNETSNTISQEITKWWTNQNRFLKQLFSYMKDGLNVKVIDHRFLLGLPQRKIKSIRFYRRLLCDDVHLEPFYYKIMVNTLVTRDLLNPRFK
jgi:hypothetical protein